MSLTHYRRFASSASAREVLRELLTRPCRFLVIVRPSGVRIPYPHVLEVNAALVARLEAAPPSLSLEDLLALPARPARIRKAWPDLSFDSRALRFGARAIVDDAGLLVGVETPAAAVKTEALYPHMESSPRAVSAGETVEVAVSLGDRPRNMFAPRIEVAFPQGVEEVVLTAYVSDARGFEQPEGEEWSARFSVRPGPSVSPPAWLFKARAVEAGHHSITVTFLSGAAAVGHIELTLDPLPGVSADVVALRPPRTGSTMAITETGGAYQFQLFDSGVPALPAEPWRGFDPMLLQTVCNELQDAPDPAAVRAQGLRLWGQVPAAVRRWLCRADSLEAPLTILSESPLLPFEAMVLADAPEQPALGVVRPVVRWIPSEYEPPQRALEVTNAVCIRPDYATPLPHQKTDEANFQGHLPASQHVGTASELQGLLRQRTDVQLLHFAGHAKGAPGAGLVMDNGLFNPWQFCDGKLFAAARPFVFLNGCLAAFALPDDLVVRSNFPKTLVVAHASGVVASVLRLIDAAAPAAAETFYQALASGVTVGEAIRRVRALAVAPPAPAHAASFMSYLAYAAPDLTLRLPLPATT